MGKISWYLCSAFLLSLTKAIYTYILYKYHSLTDILQVTGGSVSCLKTLCHADWSKIDISSNQELNHRPSSWLTLSHSPPK